MTRRGDNFRQSRIINEMRRADERRYIMSQIRREQAAKAKRASPKSEHKAR